MLFNAKYISAFEIAQQLVAIGAASVNWENPYTWSSGWRSPFYTDNRKTLSYPALRDELVDALVNVALDYDPDFEAIVGVATAGIPMGILVADRLDVPFAYVRPQPKGHGLGAQIEGHLPPNSKVLVIEDLISTGESSLKVVEALRQVPVEVLAVACIFNYGFAVAKQKFEAQSIPVHALCDFESLLLALKETNSLSEDVLQQLHQWREDPANWQPSPSFDLSAS
jgi:orotate phosphoribosyltransferase